MDTDNTQEPAEPSLASAGSHGQVGWRDAAMRLGERLATDGPRGYYYFTPEQWLQWATGVVSYPQPTLTDEEREAIEVSREFWQAEADCSLGDEKEQGYADALRGLLERNK